MVKRTKTPGETYIYLPQFCVLTVSEHRLKPRQDRNNHVKPAIPNTLRERCTQTENSPTAPPRRHVAQGGAVDVSAGVRPGGRPRTGSQSAIGR
ncbi:hypothetical protein GCM10010518_50200 [Kitasatospora cinereorecta]